MWDTSAGWFLQAARVSPRTEAAVRAASTGSSSASESAAVSSSRPRFVHKRMMRRALVSLDGYRASGEGPVFHRFGGKNVCPLPDLKDWARPRRLGGSGRDARLPD